jgi:hypothetical protein
LVDRDDPSSTPSGHRNVGRMWDGRIGSVSAMTPGPATLSDLVIARVRRFCEARIPATNRAEVRLEVDVRGRTITLLECRPPWHGGPGDWTRMKVAQIRYDAAGSTWTLHWADRNSRWHVYDDVPRPRTLTRSCERSTKTPPASSGADPDPLLSPLGGTEKRCRQEMNLELRGSIGPELVRLRRPAKPCTAVQFRSPPRDKGPGQSPFVSAMTHLRNGASGAKGHKKGTEFLRTTADRGCASLTATAHSCHSEWEPGGGCRLSRR